MEGTNRLFSEAELQPTIDFLQHEINYQERNADRLRELVGYEENYQILDTLIPRLIAVCNLIFNYQQAILKLRADVQREIQTEVI